MATNSRIGKITPIIGTVTVAPFQLNTQDIGNWKNSINSAKNPLTPRRKTLYQLFESIELDAQVIAVRGKRKVGVTNKRVVFYKKGAEGETVERIQTEIIDTPWFREFLGHLVDQKFWGHTLVEFLPGTTFPIEGINLIPRINVMPEKGMLLLNHTDVEGPVFRGPEADPDLARRTIEYGGNKDYGLYMSLAQYVIYKRGGFGDWAQFSEIFGMPFRIGEYDPYDDVTRKKLESALKDMGGAGYAVIPQGTSIKFENGNANTGQSAVFSDFIKLCNEEISKAALGGTMTTDNGSSRSQSETHKKGEEEITKSDLLDIEAFLNSTFKQKLAQFYGYNEAPNGDFRFETKEIISLKDRIAIDEKVAAQVEIDPKYWYKVYGVAMPEGGPKAKVNPTPGKPDPKEEEVTAKKKSLNLSLSHQITTLYGHNCAKCNSGNTLSLSNDKAAERLAKKIFDGKLKTGHIDKKLLKETALKLLEGINAGYLTKPGSAAFTEVDERMLAFMSEHVFVFSGFKTEKYLREASALLKDENGQLREFNEFKTKVLELDHTYNVNYLAAEYNHAVASSQMASKWIGFQKTKKDLPNIIYHTAGDNRVRPKHAVLDGVTKPVDDEFWDTHFPPNDFGCRCDADATEGAVTPDPSEPYPLPPVVFQNNVGKNGIVFPKSHPYYETSKAAAKRITEAAKSLIPK